MNSKKAQTGKIIATIPVLILTVLIMGVFMTLAFAITEKNHPAEIKATLTTLVEDNLLLQPIEVKLKDGTIKKMLVYDAGTLRLKHEIDSQELRKALDELSKKMGKCYFLTYDLDSIFGEGFSSNKEILTSQKSYLAKLNQKKISKKIFKIEGKDIEVTHYYGPCD